MCGFVLRWSPDARSVGPEVVATFHSRCRKQIAKSQSSLAVRIGVVHGCRCCAFTCLRRTGPATGCCPVQLEMCLMGHRDVLSGKLPPPGQARLAWQLHVNLELDFGRKLLLF